MNTKKYRVCGKQGFDLGGFSPGDTGGFKSADDAAEITKRNIDELADIQDRLYADGRTAVLIIIQAMDTAGKDSAVKHVMGAFNPQGVNVYDFKQPSAEELSHDYLWRAAKVLPARGKIAIFNRSYYEDVLIGKVHKLYEKQNLPDRVKSKDIIELRYKQIRNFEEYLWENGIVVVKFFLNLSKKTQHKRLLERIEKKAKNWKFSSSDLKEREYWDEYQEAYQCAIAATSTEHNPWYIVPADKKWFTRALISGVLRDVLHDIGPEYPKLSEEQEAELERCKRILDEEDL
ncbi:MAG: polyphosphate kinase 2 family protein [Oscillospiraceae bacterium]|jgi:PPK2 family polyphosphate:nucleotide phosphotransferase|nr:polyphosphate kinase 2 family protein [Oscillospiraceae bacterium]